MKTLRFSSLVPCAAALLLLPACQRGGPSASAVTLDLRHNPTGQGKPVASFGDDSISVDEVNQRLAEMAPQTRARYQTAEERQTLIDNLARFELLVKEAAREGMASDHDVVQSLKRAMVNKLLEKRSKESVVKPSDAELQSYYHAHLADFVHPEQVDLALIEIATPEGLSAKDREAKRARAQALRDQASTMAPADITAFGKLAQASSDDLRTSAVGGNTTLKPLSDIAAAYGKPVADAAHALQRIGEVSPLVDAPKGFFILKLRGRTPELNQSFDNAGVRAQITSRLNSDRRNEALEHLIQELKLKEHFKVDDALVASIKVDPTAPPVSGTGPRPPAHPLTVPPSSHVPLAPVGN